MNEMFEGEGRVVDEAMVERALGWMSRNITTLSQAIANRQHLDQWVKAVEATEKSKHKAEPAHVQEREARSSEAYKGALDVFKDCVAEEQRLRYTWQLAETVIDLFRTKCANERRA